MAYQHLIRCIAVLLIPALLINTPGFAAQAPLDPATAKARLESRGLGHGVKVILTDRSEVSGTLVRIDEESCQIHPRKAAEPLTVEYAQITSVQKGPMSKGKKIAIGVGVAAAALFAWAVIAADSRDD